MLTCILNQGLKSMDDSDGSISRIREALNPKQESPQSDSDEDEIDGQAVEKS